MESIYITFLYYALVYITLFVSVFWFVIFFSNKKKIMIAPNVPKILPSLSLIIPAYNEEDSILKSIKSVLNSDYPKNKLNVVVVDDASIDDTAKKVKVFMKNHKNVRLIQHKKNKSKAGALNTALKSIKSDIVGFLDADTILEKHSLKNMVGFLKNEETGGVIANIQPQDCKNVLQKVQKAEYVFTSLMRKLLTYINSLYITPAFALYRTALVKKLGGWDENNITEDLEMGMKLQNAGYKVETCMGAKVLTKTPETLKRFWRQRIRWYRGLIHNSKKYKHMFFNINYGDLGIYVLPLNYIVIALSVFMFIYGAGLMLFDTFNTFMNIYSIGFDWEYILTTPIEFNVQPLILIFMAIMVIGMGIMIRIGKVYAKETLSKIDYILYLALYPFIHIFLWLSVAYYEIMGKEKEW